MVRFVKIKLTRPLPYCVGRSFPISCSPCSAVATSFLSRSQFHIGTWTQFRAKAFDATTAYDVVIVPIFIRLARHPNRRMQLSSIRFPQIFTRSGQGHSALLAKPGTPRSRHSTPGAGPSDRLRRFPIAALPLPVHRHSSAGYCECGNFQP